MIKYRLICKNCNNAFDSWFSSSKEYEKLKKLRHLNCIKCNSLKVEKTLMAPSVVNSKDKIVTIIVKLHKFYRAEVYHQKYIEKNSLSHRKISITKPM